MTNEERRTTTRLSNDGTRLIIVERWLDRQMSPPRWRVRRGARAQRGLRISLTKG
jgi:hypothetical protein